MGLESAKRLAGAGARVVLTARTPAKADGALSELRAAVPGANATALVLDLASLESVRAFPARYDAEVGAPLDVLVANAGVMAIPERLSTADGFERQIGVNHLGHFALVSAMMPALRRAERGFRVVSVSSTAHQIASEKSMGAAIDADLDPKDYSQWGNYGLSKAANVLFANELQRRLDKANITASAVSLHPGVVQTDLWRYMAQGKEAADPEWSSKDMEKDANFVQKIIQQTFSQVGPIVTVTAERGANTQIFLAAGADSGGDLSGDGGKYFENMRVATAAAFTENEDLAKRLWEVSEKLVGAKIEFPSRGGTPGEGGRAAETVS